LKDEGEVQDFLGIRIRKEINPQTNEVLKITMTQTGLIDQILKDVHLLGNKDALKLHTAHPTTVPAKCVLNSPLADEPYDAEWGYRSLIGKLNFLALNTRPDIAMATHQCARFLNNPTKTHQNAVKQICRYLLATRDKGITLRPNDKFELDSFVDSDFCGAWSIDTSHRRESALSCTGYIVTFAGCPVHWISKLQTEICLSTTEAELQALSMCMRDLIPMRAILEEVCTALKVNEVFDMSVPGKPKLKPSTVHEDNSACLEIASTEPKYRPRTKHLCIKWHRFRDEIQNGNIIVKAISTHDQLADALTKPLQGDKFYSIVDRIMGWTREIG
jgi:hypothetical protein